MSLVIELERNGKKAGKVCDASYRRGGGCPLIVRQTSEDVLTANVFGILRRLRPELWLTPMMSAAFPSRLVERPACQPEVSFWTAFAPPPERSHDEGNTEVDVHVRWGNASLYLEAKYGAPLASGTASDASRDQLIRLLDVAYHHDVEGQLFNRLPFILVLAMPEQEPSLVTKYRKPTEVRTALSSRGPAPSFAKATYLAQHVGYMSWLQLASLLSAPSDASELERALLDDVVEYIRVKRTLLPILRSAS